MLLIKHKMNHSKQKGQGIIWIVIIVAIIGLIVFWVSKNSIIQTSTTQKESTMSTEPVPEPSITPIETRSLENIGDDLLKLNSEVKDIDNSINDTQSKIFQEEVGRRLSVLNTLSQKADEITIITSTEKQTLKTMVDEEIKSLESIIIYIGDESSASGLQQEKKIVANSYSTFALYVPKVRIIAHANMIVSIADALTAITSDSVLMPQIDDAKVKAQNAVNLVTPLTPENYPGFKTTFKTARDLLKTARMNLNNVYSILRENSKLIENPI